MNSFSTICASMSGVHSLPVTSLVIFSMVATNTKYPTIKANPKGGYIQQSSAMQAGMTTKKMKSIKLG